MALKTTVRMGGDSGADVVDYTAEIPLWTISDEGAHTSIFEAGMKCDSGNACQWQFTVINDAGDIPRADLTKNLPAFTRVIVTEDAPGYEAALSYGRIARKDIDGGDHPHGDSRTFRVTVNDANFDLTDLDLVANWVRPAESGRARVLAAIAAFLSGAPRLTTDIENHLVAAGGEVTMPAHTYAAGTTLIEILNDCASIEGKVYSVVIHHVSNASHLCFLYIDEDDHTTYASTISVTDDAPNLTTSFPPIWDMGPSSLEDGDVDPISHLISKYGVDEDSFYVADNTARVVQYDYRARSYNDSKSETPAQAAARAEAVLESKGREHVSHQLTLKLRADQVDLLCAGMSIDIKSARAMGGLYLGTTQTRRIAEIKWEPLAPEVGAVVGFYNAHLTLERPSRILPEAKGTIGPKPPTTGTAALLGAACSNSSANLPSGFPAWSGDNEERVEITVASAVAVGSTMIAVTTFNQIGAEPEQVYDEQGNTWTKDAEYENTGSAVDDTIQIWRAPVTTALSAGDYVRFAQNVGLGGVSLDTSGHCLGVYTFPGSLSAPSVGTGAGAFGSTVALNTPAGGVVIAALAAGQSDNVITVTPDGDWSAMVPFTKVGGTSTANTGVFAQQLASAGATTWTVPLSRTTDYAAISVGYTYSGGITSGPLGTVGGTGSSSPGPGDHYIPVGSTLEHEFITDGGPYHEADQIITDDGTTVQEALDNLESADTDLDNRVSALEALDSVLSYSEAVGDGSATSFNVTHGLGTTDVQVQAWDLSGSLPELVGVIVTVLDDDTVTVSTAPTVVGTTALRVVVHGSPGASSGGGGGGGSFAPDDISDLGLWLDADDASTFTFGTGTAVATWADKSGAGRNMTQATTANQPSRVTGAVNGRAVVRFDGTNDRVELGSGNLDLTRNLSGMTLFVVNQVDDTTDEKTLFWSSINGSNSSRAMLQKSTGAAYVMGGRRLDADSFDQMATPPTYSASDVVIDQVDYDWADSAIYHYLDGTLNDSDTGFTTNGSTSDTDSQFIAIGRGSVAGSPAQFLDGDVCEVLAYRRVLTSDERDDVVAYLTDKWLGGDDINVQSVWVGGIEEE